jgi:DNA-binding LytR/AlgR family response regulator
MKTIKYIENLPQVHVGSRKYLAPTDILHLESDSNYTKILMTNGQKILSSTTLKIIENRLLPFKNFIRINRQSVVNLDFVEHIENQICMLPNGVKLTFSRRKSKAWQERITVDI